MASRLPELLAPAGNLHCALTAFENGADAVYAGLSRFNAREMGENFSYEDMARLSTQAKRAGKKIYITLNTLVKEHEFPDFIKTVDTVAALEPDGIIVQDLGVSSLIRDQYPELEIHASTQMGFHNTAGLDLAARLGIRRVILERQITMEELRVMAENPPVDLEVFIHGALCCSLSGQCIFSSWIGGWSGNRGKCKQPCRRRYHAKDGAGFYFSTQDLYTLDLIGEYIRLGIRSLKIEGRLKKPDYIAATTRAYRRVLDSGGEDPAVLKEARDILSRSYGRRWSHGFSSDEDMETVLQHDSLGVSGQLIGRVLSFQSEGLKVRLHRPLYSGDRVRVQPDSGDEGPAFTVDLIISGVTKTRRAGKGEEVLLPYDGEAPALGNLYRIGVQTTAFPDLLEAIPPFTPRKPVYLSAHVSRQGIELGVLNMKGLPVFSLALGLEEAQRHPLQPEDLRQVLKQTKEDDFIIRLMKVDISGNFFLPARDLKGIRKEFRPWLISHLASGELFPYPPKGSKNGRAPGPGERRPDLRDACYVSGGGVHEKGTYRVGGIFEGFKGIDEVILPSFCPQGELALLRRRVAEACERGIRRFRLTSLFQLLLFESCKDVTLTASYPLPAVNARGMTELAIQGISRIQGWIELGKSDLEELKRLCPVDFEVYLRGRPPILVTRAKTAVSGPLGDARGKNFYIEYDDRRALTHLYPEEVMEIPRMKGAAGYIDLTHLPRGTAKTTDFNYLRGLA
ncbi:MAG: U32 family peptidase [Spirochaetales bacterium]|nr:U32 family peptidase [Spirochaetales bacterium]